MNILHKINYIISIRKRQKVTNLLFDAYSSSDDDFIRFLIKYNKKHKNKTLAILINEYKKSLYDELVNYNEYLRCMKILNNIIKLIGSLEKWQYLYNERVLKI